MNLYEKFRKMKQDFSLLGLQKGLSRKGYFCTPVGAKILGWAGVDGIHFIQIRDLGGMVFAVSPANTPGDYVHPLAENFKDFLKLWLACGDTAPMEQAHGWTQEDFDQFLQKYPPDEEQKGLLQQLAETFHIKPMEHPFEYMKKIQSEFSYRKLRFKKEYFEWAPLEPLVPDAPEWKVYYHSASKFFGHYGRERPGKEIPVHQQFIWEEEIWHIPAAYACGAGLVIDLLLEGHPEKMKEYIKKWDLFHTEGKFFTEKQYQEAEKENPLFVALKAEVWVNRKLLPGYSVTIQGWIPGVFPEMDNLEAKWILEHYQLEKQKSWGIYRLFCPWATRNKPEVYSIKMVLKAEDKIIEGEHFIISEAGKNVVLHHPVSGKIYTLKVEEFQQACTGKRYFEQDPMEYPSCFTQMTYTVSPIIPKEEMMIKDSVPSDALRVKDPTVFLPDSYSSIGVMILQSSDETETNQKEMVCSSLHFEPAGQIEWMTEWRQKTRNPIIVDIK